MVSVIDRIRGVIPFVSGPGNVITNQCKELERMYSKRQEMFGNWYRLLNLDDELAQENMESFVGNDPRTTWNMGNFLLQPKPLVPRVVTVDGTPLLPSQRDIVPLIEDYFTSVWKAVDGQDTKRGRQSWFWGFIGFLLATGWYALPHLVGPDGKLFIDYWNPAQVFPEFDDDGLVRLARIRTIGENRARSIALREGWAAPERRGPVIEYQLWIRLEGRVFHGVSFDNKEVKPLQLVNGLIEIPILVGAVGGIPNIVHKLDSTESDGASILSTNEKIYRNFNKQMSFLQQLLRDTANPRIFQRVSGNRKIIASPEEWYARGAFFQGGPNDSIEVIPMPAIPVELTSILFQLRNQAQRGSFSDLAFGNVIQEVSAIILSQAADSARQLLYPYHTGIQFATSMVNTGWYNTLLANPTARPSSWPDIKPGLMDNTRVVTTYNISIPGDLNNRILMAKQLNPRLEIPVDDVMSMMLPEITNVDEALAKLDAEKARLHPSYQVIQIINAFDAAAAQSDRTGNTSLSRLYRIASGQLKRQLTGEAAPADRLGITSSQSAASGILPDNTRQRLGL